MKVTEYCYRVRSSICPFVTLSCDMNFEKNRFDFIFNFYRCAARCLGFWNWSWTMGLQH